MKAVVYPDASGEWRWHVRGDNGEIVAHGESYMRRIDAEDCVRLLFGAPQVDVEIHGRGGELTHNYRLGTVHQSAGPPLPCPHPAGEEQCQLPDGHHGPHEWAKRDLPPGATVLDLESGDVHQEPGKWDAP